MSTETASSTEAPLMAGAAATGDAPATTAAATNGDAPANTGDKPSTDATEKPAEGEALLVRPGDPGSLADGLAAAAIEAGNPSAIDGLAKTITALNGSVGSGTGRPSPPATIDTRPASMFAKMPRFRVLMFSS